jgi:hypothetical protein
VLASNILKKLDGRDKCNSKKIILEDISSPSKKNGRSTPMRKREITVLRSTKPIMRPLYEQGLRCRVKRKQRKPVAWSFQNSLSLEEVEKWWFCGNYSQRAVTKQDTHLFQAFKGKHAHTGNRFHRALYPVNSHRWKLLSLVYRKGPKKRGNTRYKRKKGRLPRLRKDAQLFGDTNISTKNASIAYGQPKVAKNTIIAYGQPKVEKNTNKRFPKPGNEEEKRLVGQESLEKSRVNAQQTPEMAEGQSTLNRYTQYRTLLTVASITRALDGHEANDVYHRGAPNI